MTPRAYRNVVLLAGSLLFYALGDLSFLPLLVCSAVVNYALSRKIAYRPSHGSQKRREAQQSRHRRLIWLIAAILLNTAVLLWFKFYGGALPLGISFYTFQVLSFLIDSWRGEIEKPVPFLSFCIYLSLFPKLGSGPITPYGTLADSITDRDLTAENVEEGLKLFTAGLAAKVLLADRFAPLWSQMQTIGYESISTPLAWLGAVGYSLNLYFDFCGYSLMAVGLGRMMGFSLPENFHDPYMASSVREFYRRWHMTLGAWFKKYIYIPLGGNRKGEGRTVLNLLAVWILTALWHGVTVNFLLWGGLIWVCIVLERQVGRLARKRRSGGKESPPQAQKGETSRRPAAARKRAGRVVSWTLSHFYLWIVITVSWVCFAVPNLADLGTYLGRMFGVLPGINVNAADWLKQLGSSWWLFLLGFAACTPLPRKIYACLKDRLVGKVILALLFWACVLRVITAGDNPFMYFAF